jgi:hypothetical protein
MGTDGSTIAVGAHIHANRHAARLAGAGVWEQGVFVGSVASPALRAGIIADPG